MDPITSGGAIAARIMYSISALLVLIAVLSLLAYFRAKQQAKPKYDAHTKKHKQYQAHEKEMRDALHKNEYLSDYDILRSWEGKGFDRKYGDPPRRYDYEPDGDTYAGWTVFPTLIAAVITGFTAWAMYPYGSEYHEWRTVQGTVTDSTGRRVDASDSGLYSSFVVSVDGKKYVCDEARCADLQKGDKVKFRVKLDYQLVGAPIREANYVSSSRP